MKRYYLCPFTRGGNPGFMVFDTKTEQVTWVNPNHVHENALLQWAVKAVTEDEWVRVALAGFPLTPHWWNNSSRTVPSPPRTIPGESI